MHSCSSLIVQKRRRSRELQVAAVADVHSPRYLDEFRRSISDCHRPDLFLLAGDLIDSGKVHEYRRVTDVIDSRLGNEFPIVACFGNEEKQDIREDIVRLVGHRVKFLEEMTFRVDIGEARVGIVGASPVVVNPVMSNDGGIHAIREAFERRAERLSRLLAEVADTSTHTILLVHYSPLVQAVSESDSNTFSWWVSKIVEVAPPDVIVHGHVHNSTHVKVMVSHTRVLNVAFPLVNKVTEFRL